MGFEKSNDAVANLEQSIIKKSDAIDYQCGTITKVIDSPKQKLKLKNNPKAINDFKQTFLKLNTAVQVLGDNAKNISTNNLVQHSAINFMGQVNTFFSAYKYAVEHSGKLSNAQNENLLNQCKVAQLELTKQINLSNILANSKIAILGVLAAVAAINVPVSAGLLTLVACGPNMVTPEFKTNTTTDIQYDKKLEQVLGNQKINFKSDIRPVNGVFALPLIGNIPFNRSFNSIHLISLSANPKDFYTWNMGSGNNTGKVLIEKVLWDKLKQNGYNCSFSYQQGIDATKNSQFVENTKYSGNYKLSIQPVGGFKTASVEEQPLGNPTNGIHFK